MPNPLKSGHIGAAKGASDCLGGRDVPEQDIFPKILDIIDPTFEAQQGVVAWPHPVLRHVCNTDTTDAVFSLVVSFRQRLIGSLVCGPPHVGFETLKIF